MEMIYVLLLLWGFGAGYTIKEHQIACGKVVIEKGEHKCQK
jgi:hypothetical protein